MIRVGVLTISDKCYKGERVDESGEVIKQLMGELAARVECYDVVPDERPAIAGKLVEWCDEKRLDVIITTGGTGLGARDVTPEATLGVIDKEAPGIAEALRIEGLKYTPKAVLSRGVAGVRRGTLIINLPGSPKAVREGLTVLLPVLEHAVQALRGEGH